MAHAWPGNARELDNVLQRAMLLREGDRIDAADLSIDAIPVVQDNEPKRLGDIGRSAETEAIRPALAATGGHRLRPPDRPGISGRTRSYRTAHIATAPA